MTSLCGVVTSGLGQGARFVAVPWVRDVVRRTAGFDPYPGTFNVRLEDPRTIAEWRRIRQAAGLRVDPPAPGQCGARLIAVTLAPDVAAAVIVPDVTGHGDDVLELVAGVHLRSILGLREGDPVTLQIPATTASRQRGAGTHRPMGRGGGAMLWLWLLAVGVGLVVGLMAFTVASQRLKAERERRS